MTELPIPLDKKTELSEILIDGLHQAVLSRPADALLLSGGVDSSLLAALDPKVPTFTVGLQDTSSDLQAARIVVDHLGLDWHRIEINQSEALSLLQELVLLTRSYDLGLLNDIAPYKAMKYATSLGAHTIRTGDFADTLFQGYGYLRETDMATYLDNLLPHVTLASSRIAEKMNLNTHYPYLDQRVVAPARHARFTDNVVEVETTREGEFLAYGQQNESGSKRTWTKVLLRRAAIGYLPMDTIYRTRTDLEFGSGMYVLEETLGQTLDDNQFASMQQEGFKYWNKAHAALHRMFIANKIPIPEPRFEIEYACTWCGGANPVGRGHCLTCGGYPANK